jgi:hypothetical protein
MGLAGSSSGKLPARTSSTIVDSKGYERRMNESYSVTIDGGAYNGFLLGSSSSAGSSPLRVSHRNFLGFVHLASLLVLLKHFGDAEC